MRWDHWSHVIVIGLFAAQRGFVLSWLHNNFGFNQIIFEYLTLMFARCEQYRYSSSAPPFSSQCIWIFSRIEFLLNFTEDAAIDVNRIGWIPMLVVNSINYVFTICIKIVSFWFFRSFCVLRIIQKVSCKSLFFRKK